MRVDSGTHKDFSVKNRHATVATDLAVAGDMGTFSTASRHYRKDGPRRELALGPTGKAEA